MAKPEISDVIANYLFASGHGKEADRLLLVIENSSCSAKVSDAQYLGGWSKKAVKDAVSRIADTAAREAVAETWKAAIKIAKTAQPPIKQLYTPAQKEAEDETRDDIVTALESAATKGEKA